MDFYPCESCGRYISADHFCPYCEREEHRLFNFDWDSHDVDAGDNYGTPRDHEESGMDEYYFDDEQECPHCGEYTRYSDGFCDTCDTHCDDDCGDSDCPQCGEDCDDDY